MEKLPSFVLRLSLEEMSLRRVVANLWNETDVLASIVNVERLTGRENENAWKEIVEDKVEHKVSELVVPKALKKPMMQMVKPIGSEIRMWKRYHERYLSNSIEEFDVPILEKLCWTCTGTVEYQKTAEQLIRCGMLDVVKRYKLACLYCLEDYIPICWEELPEDIKSTFYNEEDTSLAGKPHLHFCWPYILKGEEYKLANIFQVEEPGEFPDTVNQAIFECSSYTGNKAAAQYFLQKVTNEGGNAPLHLIASDIARVRRLSGEFNLQGGYFPESKRTNLLLCYLLPLLTPEQLMEAIREQPISFFVCFLDWPWQDLFLEMADLIWPYLFERDYEEFIIYMLEGYDRSGGYFPELFPDFFIHSPIEFRKYFAQSENALLYFLSALFDNEDSENIKVIFRNIDVDDRLKLVSCDEFYRIIFYVKDKWHLFELCIREATLTKEGRKSVKGAFMEHVNNPSTLRLLNREKQEQEWIRFFLLLDEPRRSTTTKRSLEVETLTEAKKLHTEQ